MFCAFRLLKNEESSDKNVISKKSSNKIIEPPKIGSELYLSSAWDPLRARYTFYGGNYSVIISKLEGQMAIFEGDFDQAWFAFF